MLQPSQSKCQSKIVWIQSGRSTRVYRAFLLIVASSLLNGCWWQRDSYTARMQQRMSRFEKDAEYDRLLGDPFDGTADFAIWVRPPKATTRRALPAELEGAAIGLFQGTEGTSALIEVIITGSAGPESLGDFEQKSFAALNKAGKGPSSELKRQDPAEVPCMHGGTTAFEVYSGGAARQVAGAAAATNYQWVCYFAEEGAQKIMVAFIVPDDIYTAFSPAMIKCLESLALAGKVSVARAGAQL
jgi:hypothetical protein